MCDTNDSPVAWHKKKISRTQKADSSPHTFAQGPFLQVRLFPVDHGVSVVGVVHRIGVKPFEGVRWIKNQEFPHSFGLHKREDLNNQFLLGNPVQDIGNFYSNGRNEVLSLTLFKGK